MGVCKSAVLEFDEFGTVGWFIFPTLLQSLLISPLKLRYALQLHDSDQANAVSRAKPEWGVSSSTLLTNEAHPCAKFKKSAALPLTHSPPAFLSAHWSICPLLLHSSFPLSNGNGTEPCWSSSARSEPSLLRREFMDYHAVFLRFGPACTGKFSSWPNHFGHSLSGSPQYTVGLWLLLSCIMEENRVPVPSLYTDPPLTARQ